jgi:hypothetical protein
VDERDLVALICRADWTKLSLSGAVDGDDPTDSVIAVGQRGADFTAARALPPFRGELLVAAGPGMRYRVATADGARARGYDGSRTWEWLRTMPPGVRIAVKERPQPPVPLLLCPSWLLSGHRLAVQGSKTVFGRRGIRIVATPFHRWDPLYPAHPGQRRVLGHAPRVRYAQALVIVDAELGIALRVVCQDEHAGAVQVTKFLRLTAGPGAVSPGEFDAPDGSLRGSLPGSGGADFARTVGGPLAEAGWEAAKFAGGLAAGGLGIASRLTPSRRARSFAQATSEEPDAALPAGDPLPAALRDWSGGDGTDPGLPPVPDDVLHLVWRGGLEPVPFTGTLHQWGDGTAVLDAVPEPARQAGLGGVGFLIGSLQAKITPDGGVLHQVQKVRFADARRFRIDKVRPAAEAGGRRQLGWRTAAADGQRYWEVREDRTQTRRLDTHTDLPGEVAVMADGSWLLGCRLFAGPEAVVDGRRGYQVNVASPAPSGLRGAIGGDWLPAVAVVDAETGRLLRLTRYLRGRVAVVFELRSIGPVGADGFDFSPPAGRVVDKDAELKETMAAMQARAEAAMRSHRNAPDRP